MLVLHVQRARLLRTAIVNSGVERSTSFIRLLTRDEVLVLGTPDLHPTADVLLAAPCVICQSIRTASLHAVQLLKSAHESVVTTMLYFLSINDIFTARAIAIAFSRRLGGAKRSSSNCGTWTKKCGSSRTCSSTSKLAHELATISSHASAYTSSTLHIENSIVCKRNSCVHAGTHRGRCMRSRQAHVHETPLILHVLFFDFLFLRARLRI